MLAKTENILSVKGKKKMIQQHTHGKYRKVVTLKDAQNISDRMKDRLVICVNTLIDEMRKINAEGYNLFRL